jgi:cell division protein FtsL
MAAATTTFEVGRSWTARVAERNAELLAQQALRRRGVRTPEFYFTKHFDNSRLVKAPDPVRVREMRVFTAAVTVLFSLIMIYGLQHFSAIERSYRVEAEKQQLDQLREENRQLKLNEAQLTQPARIDTKARELGLAAPQPGQVIHPSARVDASAPALAQVNAPMNSPAAAVQ